MNRAERVHEKDPSGKLRAPRRTGFMLDEVFKELRAGIEKATESLKRELSKVRTGRAHASSSAGRMKRSYS